MILWDWDGPFPKAIQAPLLSWLISCRANKEERFATVKKLRVPPFLIRVVWAPWGGRKPRETSGWRLELRKREEDVGFVWYLVVVWFLCVCIVLHCCMSMSMYICMGICMHVCMNVCMGICMHVCVWIMCLQVCACVSVYMYFSVCVCVCGPDVSDMT